MLPVQKAFQIPSIWLRMSPAPLNLSLAGTQGRLYKAVTAGGTFLSYTLVMEVTISQFRRELFSLVEAALQGEPLIFVHKGVHFKVVPEIGTNRLSQLTPLQVVNPKYSDSQATGLQEEMEKAWQEDWSTL